MPWGVIGGLLVGLVGGIWILQGLNFLAGSPMTGDPFWAWAGLVLVVVGTVVVTISFRRRAANP